jgi:putative CRISPR-associated protein (TIGR02620 family)
MTKFLVVTRHPALVDYLREIGLIDGEAEVVDHATPELVTGRHVIGVLPHSLSCLTASFTEVPLRLTPELRGKELDLETLRKIAGRPVTYRVERL